MLFQRRSGSVEGVSGLIAKGAGPIILRRAAREKRVVDRSRIALQGLAIEYTQPLLFFAQQEATFWAGDHLLKASAGWDVCFNLALSGCDPRSHLNEKAKSRGFVSIVI
jgi:hypothetical protein